MESGAGYHFAFADDRLPQPNWLLTVLSSFSRGAQSLQATCSEAVVVLGVSGALTGDPMVVVWVWTLGRAGAGKTVLTTLAKPFMAVYGAVKYRVLYW